jgi:two-component system cell cycle sensor histidine kinase/response regulator CckA
MTAMLASRPTILVVETDEAIRARLYRAFNRAGFKVLLTSSGERAVQLYKGVQSAVALVLLSAHRPGLNGRRVLAALQEINPAIRCVIATDVAPEDEILPLVRQGAIGLLSKPLDLDDAVRVVSQVLENDWVTPARNTTSSWSG